MPILLLFFSSQRFVSLFSSASPLFLPRHDQFGVGLFLDPAEGQFLRLLACCSFLHLFCAQTVRVCQCRRLRPRRRRLRPISRDRTPASAHTRTNERRCLRPSAPLPADSGSRLLLEGELRPSVPLHVEVEVEEGEKRKEPIAQNRMRERRGREGGRLKKEEASPCRVERRPRPSPPPFREAAAAVGRRRSECTAE